MRPWAAGGGRWQWGIAGLVNGGEQHEWRRTGAARGEAQKQTVAKTEKQGSSGLKNKNKKIEKN